MHRPFKQGWWCLLLALVVGLVGLAAFTRPGHAGNTPIGAYQPTEDPLISTGNGGGSSGIGDPDAPGGVGRGNSKFNSYGAATEVQGPRASVERIPSERLLLLRLQIVLQGVRAFYLRF